ncbi:hypothetical protein [Ralstonia sp. A12]|uniref:hypothetical protein n=1 Tax=Ralstonia sp. A12 TaxID=1217052 RepID=UPI0012EEA1AE|nr:hypothetical protein [Ralstonia sp. A12]
MNADEMLNVQWVNEAIARIQNGTITRRDPDRVSWPLIRDLIGKAPPGNPEMYEVEAVQTVFRSTDTDFVELAYRDWQKKPADGLASRLSEVEMSKVKQFLLEHDISNALRNMLN